jgi:hypothetical protein|tara:strand:+ start:1705 stop:2640 length:936 start_codon:yes stop_codon:yes gene_type:complete
MQIHINNSIEYEKVKDSVVDAIALTRKRIAVQQLFDSNDNKEELIVQLENYLESFEQLYQELIRCRHIPLKITPLFSWQIDNIEIASASWKVEQIIPKVALANLYLTTGQDLLPNYKQASTLFTKALQLHTQIKRDISSWKWKSAEMNQFIFKKSWHTSMINYLQGLQHLSMVAVGIEKNTASKTLLTVAERAVRSATLSILHWSNDYEPENLLPLCQSLQMYFSSKVLWQQEKYGQSIFRMRQVGDAEPVQSSFEAINTELAKVGLLLNENERINNGAYFETVVEGTPLMSPYEMVVEEQMVVEEPKVNR